MEMIATGISEKLENARSLCPGLREETYILAEYMSRFIEGCIDPSFLLCWLIMCLNDIKYGNVDKRFEKKDFIEKNVDSVLQNAQYIVQIVDKITSEKFSKEFRNLCLIQLNFDPPKYGEVTKTIPVLI